MRVARCDEVFPKRFFTLSSNPSLKIFPSFQFETPEDRVFGHIQKILQLRSDVLRTLPISETKSRNMPLKIRISPTWSHASLAQRVCLYIGVKEQNLNTTQKFDDLDCDDFQGRIHVQHNVAFMFSIMWQHYFAFNSQNPCRQCC